MLKFAIRQKSPVAIRYPRGEAYTGLEDYRAPIEMGKAEILEKGKEIAILAVGNMVRTAVQVTENLRNRGYEPTLVNMRFVKPLDMDLLEILREDHSLIVTLEENVKSGGFGEQVMTYYGSRLHSPAVRIVAIEDKICSAWKCGRSDASAADGQCICDRENSSMERRTTEKY